MSEVTFSDFGLNVSKNDSWPNPARSLLIVKAVHILDADEVVTLIVGPDGVRVAMYAVELSRMRLKSAGNQRNQINEYNY